MFGLVFLFLRHSEQGDGKAGQAGAQAPLQETGHHLRAEDWEPEISCEHLQYNACKSGMRGVPQPAAPPMEQLYICQWVFLPRLRFLLQINLRSILQPWLTFCAWEGITGWHPKFSRVYPTQSLTVRWCPLPGWYSIQQGPAGGPRARASVFRVKNSTFSSRMNPVSFDKENLNDQVLSVPITPYRQKQP